MRRKVYKWLAKVVTQHNSKVLLFCVVMTIAMLLATGRLRMKTQFEDMMPQDIPQVVEFRKIIDDYTSTSPIMIAIESKEKNIDLMKECAEDIAQRFKKLIWVKPSKGQKYNAKQIWQLFNKEHPVKGVTYDTVQLVKRIDYKVDNEFFAKHGMIIQKRKDLESFQDMYSSIRLPNLLANINDNFEKEYVEDVDNLNSLDGEYQAVQGLENIYKFIKSIDEYVDNKDSANITDAVNSFMSIPEYMISSDNTLLLLLIRPNVNVNNQLDEAMNLGLQVKDSLDVIAKSYPDLELGAAGSMVLQVDENRALAKDFGPKRMLLTLLLILILLVGSFRTWKNPFFSVVTLVLAIIWVTGFLALTLKFLNIMSASFGIILVGLGIDFGIHLMSGYRDGREQGLSVQDAVAYMYDKVASGVVTGALTTAIVFYMMALINFKAFMEMGVAVGSGIVITLIVMMILLPALIVFDNKGYTITGKMLRKIYLGFIPNSWNVIMKGIYWLFNLPIITIITRPLQFTFLEGIGKLIGNLRIAVFLLIFGAAVTYLSYEAGKKIEFEYDFMEMEPIGIPSVITQDKILDKFEIATDYAMLRVENLDECREKIKKLKKVGNRTGLIGRIDGVTEFLPTEEKQHDNIPIINDFRKKIQDLDIPQKYSAADHKVLLGELKRLHQNIVEIGEQSVLGSGENNKVVRKCDDIVGKKDEDSKLLAIADKLSNTANVERVLEIYQRVASSVLKEKLLKMTSTEIITMEKLPNDIKEQYINPNNNNLLVTIYPKSDIWQQKTLEKFNEITTKISEKITGMPAIMLLYIDLTKEKGLQAMLLGALAIVVFLLIDFRSIRYTIFGVLSLGMGAVWMVGLMAVFGIKFNYTNFMALPLIIGIGIDDSVHILHRYKIEGSSRVSKVLRYTGRAILLTSLTTMIGFGSWGLASHRGIASMGQVLFLGVGTCFISSVFILPALIVVVDKILPGKKNKKSGQESEARSQNKS